MIDQKKFSLSIRIDSITPVHVRLSLFSGMILEELPHDRATRGKSGDLTLHVTELAPFLERVRPDVLTARPDVSPRVLRQYTGVSIHD